MRHAAPFALGVMVGVLLALLLTSNATSRQPSAPRPAAVTPLAPVGTPAADRGADHGGERSAPTSGGLPLADDHRTSAPSADPSATIGKQPASTEAPATAKPSPGKTPRPSVRPAHGLRGVATWYAASKGTAAAGPALRAALGKDWRGDRVRVCAGGECVTVRLTDWCACGPRHGKPTLIDLGRRLVLPAGTVGRRRHHRGDPVIVALYLAAVAAANLSVAAFGPGVSVLNAFLFVGLDLTSRDRLHDAWKGRQLWPRMALLIAAGGLISFLLNRDAAQIAVASTVAFTVAGVLDAVTYALLGDRSRLVRVNGSNVVAAAADSLIFPTLAFGSFFPLIVLAQFAAKVGGGLVWSLILAVPQRRRTS